ncbi:MAG TPA: SDR family oxidoreductase [Longimicrobiaceae bacterium]|nr:SDR family oxidoreductase [Longimicrobiaceae bacterium]
MIVDARAEVGGRLAVVTGASRGIGLEVARLLGEAGARVAMVARTERDLAAAADAVGGHALPADVTSPESVRSLAARVVEWAGDSPEIVVNCAGAFAIAPLVETDPEVFARGLDVNLRGPFLVTRAFLPRMMERGGGSIVNVGSIAGRVALPGNAAYSASKFGLRGLHEVLSAEVRGTGVRATLVEPAATDTPLWDPLDPDSRPDLPARAEMLRPAEVARAILFALAQPPEVEISVVSLRSARR